MVYGRARGPGTANPESEGTALREMVNTNLLPVGSSGQLGKEITDTEDLFSQYGEGLGRTGSTPHRGKCAVGVELLEFIQG